MHFKSFRDALLHYYVLIDLFSVFSPFALKGVNKGVNKLYFMQLFNNLETVDTVILSFFEFLQAIFLDIFLNYTVDLVVDRNFSLLGKVDWVRPFFLCLFWTTFILLNN